MKFQILSTTFNDNKFQLSESINNSDNIYTLITGKNGLGKTRLLNFIILKYMKDNYRRNFYSRSEKVDENTLKNFEINAIGTPNKVIVHTNSKFDKFPSDIEIPTRKYININEISSHNDSDNFFYKILLNKNINLKSVKNTLNYLNYDSKIKFELSIPLSSTPAGYLEKMIENFHEDLVKIGFNTLRKDTKLSRKDKKFLNLLHYIYERGIQIPNTTELKTIYNLYHRANFYDYINEIIVDLNEKDMTLRFFTRNEFSILLKYKLIIIHHIYLQNLKVNSSLFECSNEEYISFYHLSSGQKSIINTLLGISSVIESNSLICIDEPEISLHPEWQEEIILKLQEAFIDKEGCHFLIATHSPQVVSGLKSENGFIHDLENKILFKSKDFTKKSADFQLATIFNSPGNNNEFLIRIALTLLSKIAKKLDLNSTDLENLNLLNNSREELPDNDPVSFLIEQLNALV